MEKKMEHEMETGYMCSILCPYSFLGARPMYTAPFFERVDCGRYLGPTCKQHETSVFDGPLLC